MEVYATQKKNKQKKKRDASQKSYTCFSANDLKKKKTKTKNI